MVLTYDRVIEDNPNNNFILIQFGENWGVTQSKPVRVPRNVILCHDEYRNEIELLDSFAFSVGMEESNLGH